MSTNSKFVQVGISEVTKYDGKKHSFYSYDVLTTLVYKKNTWNQDENKFNDDGEGVLFCLKHKDVVEASRKMGNGYSIYASYNESDLKGTGDGQKLCTTYTLYFKKYKTNKLILWKVICPMPISSTTELAELSEQAEKLTSEVK